jgi:hypothetical protein
MGEMTTIWYEMNTNDQLSQSVPHPEEPVDQIWRTYHTYTRMSE